MFRVGAWATMHAPEHICWLGHYVQGCWRMGHVGAWVTMPQNADVVSLGSGWRMGHYATERGFICHSGDGWLGTVSLDFRSRSM